VTLYSYQVRFCVCLCLTTKSSAVRVRGQELIYDFCWYPHMNAAYPETCCMVGTSRDNPIQLWDSVTGLLRCTYRAFDDMVSVLDLKYHHHCMGGLRLNENVEAILHCVLQFTDYIYGYCLTYYKSLE